MRVISGTARGVKLKTPDGMQTRPTVDRVKEAMFSILQFELPGARILDLFGGTGQLGIEGLSRGAAAATFVDQRDDACRLIRENLKRTGLEKQGTVICSDYCAYLRNCTEKYNIIILDPPYAEEFLEKSLKMITEIDILQSGGIIVSERPVEKDLDLCFDNFVRSKDYKYGNTLLTMFRRI